MTNIVKEFIESTINDIDKVFKKVASRILTKRDDIQLNTLVIERI